MIDLCVCSYNNRMQIERMLTTIHADNHGFNWRLFLADNGSTDGTREWLQDHARDYRIEYVWYNENIGYAAACNEMAAAGTHSIIGLLNADVWLTAADTYAIDDAMDENPQCAILGPKQRDERGKITHAGIFGTNTAPRHRGWQEHDPHDEKYRDVLEAVTVSGSAYFIRRQVWNDLANCPKYQALYPDAQGAFLPTPHYFEESFCSYHARAHGHEVLYDGRISIGHSWHASSPVGGAADQQFAISRTLFRSACDFHGIAHD